MIVPSFGIAQTDLGNILKATTTKRSHFNNFISSNFYEERLICDESNDQRLIKFDKKSKIKDSGIHFIEMNHSLNVQTSIEEFEVVRDLLKDMIGLEFDDKGKTRKLTIDDFILNQDYYCVK